MVGWPGVLPRWAQAGRTVQPGRAGNPRRLVAAPAPLRASAGALDVALVSACSSAVCRTFFDFVTVSVRVHDRPGK